MKKIISALFFVILTVSVIILPAHAADKLPPEESNAQITQKVEEIQKKYGIDITYGIKNNGYATISLNNLETLDRAFSTVTPTIVKQISKYYKEHNGSKLEITYVFSSNSYNYNGGILMAAFDRASSRIYVYLPKSAGQAIISGENPIALVHELGHAYHLMAVNEYGYNSMLGEWEEFNDGISYNLDAGDVNPDKHIFISSYASTSFEEDFAETFAHAFVRNRAGTGFSSLLSNNSGLTGLGNKVHFIEELLPQCFSNYQQAVKNYKKVYSAPASMAFEGLTFSGEYLQYIDYPQPRNILKGLLNGLNITSDKTTWVRDIGAWRVIDPHGNMYFIFPGGIWMSVGDSGRNAA